MRLRPLLSLLALPLALWAALPIASGASSEADLGTLQDEIDAKRGKLNRVNGHAQVLTSDISQLTGRIDVLQGTIGTLQRREDGVQADLDAKRRELLGTQAQLRRVRARLARLRVRLVESKEVLAQRLVERYMSGDPDLMTVVLSSDGFAELLENGAYLERIGRQDRAIITGVRDAKALAAGAQRRLSALEARQQRVTTEVTARRNAVARVRDAVQHKRDRVDAVRGEKRALLHRVHGEAGKLDEDIGALQRQQEKIRARLRAAQGGTTIAPGPIRGGGRFIWPVNGPITSPFCESRSWESCHPGIDIGVPSGTPIRAAGSGAVAIAGWVSGYGNYTCVDHGGGYSTCYGHQSQLQVSVGQHVTQGEMIGLTGCTGLCFGPHLHFEVRIGGSVTNPLSYLG